jgi:hypothetical protein
MIGSNSANQGQGNKPHDHDFRKGAPGGYHLPEHMDDSSKIVITG